MKLNLETMKMKFTLLTAILFVSIGSKMLAQVPNDCY